jgi:putative sugar O-methyltransferase
MDITIWGTGVTAQELFPLIDPTKVAVVAFFDNEPSRWGSRCHGVEILPPARLGDFRDLVMVIASRAFPQIARQLAKAGFPLEQALDYFSERSRVLEIVAGQTFLVRHYHTVVADRLSRTEERFTIERPVTESLPCPVPLEARVEVARRVGLAFLDARDAAKEVSSSKYRIGENWACVVAVSREPLYSAIKNQDWEKTVQLLDNYFRSDISSSMGSCAAAFQGFVRHADDAWLHHNLRVWDYSVGSHTPLTELAVPPVGNPYGFRVGGLLINADALLNHHRAHVVRRLLEGVRRPVVVEIGGGYGGFAYYLNGGPGSLTYLNFDIPESLVISSYFLSLLFPNKRIALYNYSTKAIDTGFLSAHDIVLMPNFVLPHLAEGIADVSLNTISMSEMEHATIEEYYRQIERTCRGYFYMENLACAPSYKGFPVDTFPKLSGFQEISRAVSRWVGWDAYAFGHTYLEQVFQRNNT